MVTETTLLDYIKGILGAPLMQIEMTDDEIIHYVKTYTLPFFSQYKPLRKILVVDPFDTPMNDDGTFELPIDPEHDLIGIEKIVPDITSYIMFGHPYIPFPTWNMLPDMLLQILKSNTARKYSFMNFTYRFFRPNKLQIIPQPMNTYGVIGLFVHSLETIPGDWERDFLDLALSDIMFRIANLRLKYQSFQTPFGEINLNAQDLKNDANEIRQRVLERLQGARPPVYVRVG